MKEKGSFGDNEEGDLGSGGTDEKLNVLYTESDLTLDEDKPEQYNCIFARLSHWKHLPQGDIKEYDWDPEKYKETDEGTCQFSLFTSILSFYNFCFNYII